MPVSMVVALLCLAAAAFIGTFAYAPDLKRGVELLRRALRALTRRPHHH